MGFSSVIVKFYVNFFTVIFFFEKDVFSVFGTDTQYTRNDNKYRKLYGKLKFGISCPLISFDFKF